MSIRTVALLWALSATASAQPREGTATAAAFDLVLPVTARFGDQVVAARRYRLTLAAQGFALADPESMVFMHSLAVQEAQAAAVAEPKVKVERRGNTVMVTLHSGDRVYSAHGVVAEAAAQQATLVTLAAKEETALDRQTPEEKTARSVIEQAVKRHEPMLNECVDKAQRGRWGTDDPRFVKCLCPLLDMWRLPRLKEDLRIHHALAPGRAGVSFTATVKGKATACRVWTGAKSPEEMAAPPAAGTATP